MFSVISALERFRSLVQNSKEFRDNVTNSFEKNNLPSPFIELPGFIDFNKDYRLDLSKPPRFVWFRLSEVYIDYLPGNKEITYNVRKNQITNIQNLPI